MKPLYRILAGFILISFLSLTAVGCEDNRKTTEDSSPDIPIIKTDSKDVTLTFLIPGWKDTDASKRVFAEIENRTKGTLNISLVFKDYFKYNSDSTINIKSPFEKHEDFDAMIINEDISELVESNYIMDVSDLLLHYASGLYSKYESGDLASVTYDGQIMGIPQRIVTSQRLCAVVREDLLEECSIKEINTLEDYGKFLEELKVNEPDIIFPGLIPPDTAIFMQQYGYIPLDGYLAYKWDDPEMKIIPWEQTETFKEAYRTIFNWKSKGYISNREYIVKDMNSGILASFVWYWDTAQNISSQYKYACLENCIHACMYGHKQRK